MKKKIPALFILLGLIPFILGFLGRYNWLLDVFSHFRVYYLIYFLLLGISFILFKIKNEALISLFIAVIIGLSLIKFYIPFENSVNEEVLKIASLNILSSNNSFKEVISFIQSENPEVVILQEVNQKWYNELDLLKSEFSYQLADVREDNFGLVVFSKKPFLDSERIILSNSGVPSFRFKIELDKEDLNIIVTHPLPPIGKNYFNSRNEQFDNLNSLVKSLASNEVVLIGDLNTTSFSPNFKRITEQTSLKDSRYGFGLQSSWHAQNSLISVTIDHVLVSNGIKIIERELGSNTGSDHFPIIVELSMN